MTFLTSRFTEFTSSADSNFVSILNKSSSLKLLVPTALSFFLDSVDFTPMIVRSIFYVFVLSWIIRVPNFV